MLRGQDILLVLKIQASGVDSFANLGQSIGISASQTHLAASRAITSGLLRKDLSVRKLALLESLIALKYFFPAARGGEARGMATARSAPPLNSQILEPEGLGPVWPTAEGNVRGISFEPIYKTVPIAAAQDPVLYQYLALVDALRIGNAREQNLARAELEKRLIDK